MKINNLKTNHEWENLPCEKNPNCFHCKCKKSFESIPKNDFKFNEKDPETDTITERVIKEITLVYGAKDEVLGWSF